MLVAHRLKRSGQRWGRDGGQRVLAFRALLKSDPFDRAWRLVVPRMKRSKTLGSTQNVEKHATESLKEGESAIKLDPPSFVVETPFHQATTERPAGLICVEKIGLARRRLPTTAVPSRSGSELSA